MKKVLSIVLALSMVAALGLVAVADEAAGTGNWESGTKVEYVGETKEEYLVTVPASMTPDSTDNVTATGYWSAARKLTVSAPNTVTLTNSIDGGTKDLTVTFNGIDAAGSNTEAMNISEDISVGAITNALFGTWNGTITYTVNMADVATDGE